MNALPTGVEAIRFFADRLSEVRPLTATEQNIVDRAAGVGSFRRWSDDDDKELLRMHRGGAHGVTMANRLNRTVDGIWCRLRELKRRAANG